MEVIYTSRLVPTNRGALAVTYNDAISLDDYLHYFRKFGEITDSDITQHNGKDMIILEYKDRSHAVEVQRQSRHTVKGIVVQAAVIFGQQFNLRSRPF
jgi:hypothetical protein